MTTLLQTSFQPSRGPDLHKRRYFLLLSTLATKTITFGAGRSAYVTVARNLNYHCLLILTKSLLKQLSPTMINFNNMNAPIITYSSDPDSPTVPAQERHCPL